MVEGTVEGYHGRHGGLAALPAAVQKDALRARTQKVLLLGVGLHPDRAKPIRSRASLKSLARLTITRALQGAQDGTSRLWVCVQGPDYERAQLHPLGRDVEVHYGTLVELASELA